MTRSSLSTLKGVQLSVKPRNSKPLKVHAELEPFLSFIIKPNIKLYCYKTINILHILFYMTKNRIISKNYMDRYIQIHTNTTDCVRVIL